MLAHSPIGFAFIHTLLKTVSTELKLVIALLCAYLVAAVLRRVHNARRQQRNLASLLSSVLLLSLGFGQTEGVRSLAVSAIGTYAIAACIRGRYMPWIGFSFIMGHMFYSHLGREVSDSLQGSDIMASVQMVLVTKLTMFCWNVHDGRLEQRLLSEYRQRRALSKIPDPLDFIGYITFYPSLLAGPTFDYHLYARWLSGYRSGTTCEPDLTRSTSSLRAYETLERRRAAAGKVVQGILWLAVSYICSEQSNGAIILSDGFSNSGLIRKIWLLQVLAYSMRSKLYGIWSLAEGACIVSGIGYEGIDSETGSGRWGELQNFNSWGIETAQNPHAFVGNWNMRVHNWLYHYVYLRLTTEGKKPGFMASMATFVVSAFWHGQWPGYYLTFMLSSLLHVVAKDIRRYVRPFFLETDRKTSKPFKRYYDVLGWFLTHLAFCFTTAPVALLGLRDSLRVWSSVYFYCPVAVMLLMGIFASPAKPWLAKKLTLRSSTARTGSRKSKNVSVPLLATSLVTMLERRLYRKIQRGPHRVQLH